MAPLKKKADSDSDSDSEEVKKPTAASKKTKDASSSSDSEPAPKKETKAAAKKDDTSSDESDPKPQPKKAAAAKKDSSSSDDSDSDKKPAAKKAAAKKDSSSSDSESEKKPAPKKAVVVAKSKKEDSDEGDAEDEHEEQDDAPKKKKGFGAWMEERARKKREQDNRDFSKNVLPKWQYKYNGSLARKICYDGMLPHVRIMSWNIMIGIKTDVPDKQYQVNVKNGNQMFEKMSKQQADYETVGNEASILKIGDGVKAVYPNNPEFHDAQFEAQLTEMLKVFVAYRPDIGYFDGLNYLAAMLLQFMDKMRAFNTLVNLVVKYLQCFVVSEKKAEMDSFVIAFKLALQEENPPVYELFEEANIDYEKLLREWISSLFCGTVSYENAQRIWDILLLEGTDTMNPQVAPLYGITRVALGYLKFLSGDLGNKAEAIYKSCAKLPSNVNISDVSKCIKQVGLSRTDLEGIIETQVDEYLEEKKGSGAASAAASSSKKKADTSSDDDSSDDGKGKKKSTVAVAAKPAAAKKDDSSDSSSDDAKEEKKPEEKPAPAPAPAKKVVSSSESSSEEEKKPAPKPAPAKKVVSSDSDDSSEEEKKPVPKPVAPKKVADSDSSSD